MFQLEVIDFAITMNLVIYENDTSNKPRDSTDRMAR